MISYRSNLASRFFGEHVAGVGLISLTAVSPLRSLHNLWPKAIYLALFICLLKCLDSPSVDPVKGGQEFRTDLRPPARPSWGKALHLHPGHVAATRAGHALQLASGQMSRRGSTSPEQGVVAVHGAGAAPLSGCEGHLGCPGLAVLHSANVLTDYPGVTG